MILGALPLAVGAWQEGAAAWEALTPTDYGALIYSTLCGSALAYGLFFYFAAQGNLTSLSSLTFLTPIFALIFGGLFLQEQLTLGQIFGVGLTLISIYVVNQREQLSLKGIPSPWP
jgi:drug/metabolite transporter (DMT)-like permease